MLQKYMIPKKQRVGFPKFGKGSLKNEPVFLGFNFGNGAASRITRKTIVFLGVAREALRKTLVGVSPERLTFSLVGQGGPPLGKRKFS